MVVTLAVTADQVARTPGTAKDPGRLRRTGVPEGAGLDGRVKPSDQAADEPLDEPEPEEEEADEDEADEDEAEEDAVEAVAFESLESFDSEDEVEVVFEAGAEPDDELRLSLR
jgi:hypothetical protein